MADHAKDQMKYNYWKMRSKVRAVRTALDNAVRADRMEAALHLADFAMEPFDFTGAFQKQADALVARAEKAMARTETTCDGKLLDNASVPGDLEADAEAWRKRAGEVKAKAMECIQQRDIPDWSGAAKEKYVAAVMVQEVALKELDGVMESTANGCYAGAQLNRAIFMAVGEAATEALRAFEFPFGGGGGGNYYYTRTARVTPTLEALVDQVKRAVSGEVADGAAETLIQEMRDTVAMAIVLGPDEWPTGTSALGVEAAATDTGVTSDGSDAKTDVEAQILYCLPGITR